MSQSPCYFKGATIGNGTTSGVWPYDNPVLHHSPIQILRLAVVFDCYKLFHHLASRCANCRQNASPSGLEAQMNAQWSSSVKALLESKCAVSVGPRSRLILVMIWT